MKKTLALLTMLLATEMINTDYYVGNERSIHRQKESRGKYIPPHELVYCSKCGVELKNGFSYHNNRKVCLECKAFYKVKREKVKKPYVKIIYRKKKEVK